MCLLIQSIDSFSQSLIFLEWLVLPLGPLHLSQFIQLFTELCFLAIFIRFLLCVCLCFVVVHGIVVNE